MEDQLISFETAKLAKEKRFDIPQHYVYNQYDDLELEYIDNYNTFNEKEIKQYINFENYTKCWLCPSQSLLQRWLREVHNICIYIIPTDLDNIKWHFKIGFDKINQAKGNINDTYEQSLEEALLEALKLIK